MYGRWTCSTRVHSCRTVVERLARELRSGRATGTGGLANVGFYGQALLEGGDSTPSSEYAE